jgi:apolipoprotein N-acyltransferase
MQKKHEKTLNNSCTTALHHKNNRGPSLVALVFWATFFTLFFLAFAFPVAAFACVAWACPAATVFSSFLMQSEQRTAPGRGEFSAFSVWFGIFRNLLGSPWMLPARRI